MMRATVASIAALCLAGPQCLEAFAKTLLDLLIVPLIASPHQSFKAGMFPSGNWDAEKLDNLPKLSWLQKGSMESVKLREGSPEQLPSCRQVALPSIRGLGQGFG